MAFQVPLARFLMMYTENDTTTFHLLAPQKGIYLLDIFAATYPSMDMCTKKEATKYINVCRFKIDCPDIDMVRDLIKNHIGFRLVLFSFFHTIFQVRVSHGFVKIS